MLSIGAINSNYYNKPKTQVKQNPTEQESKGKEKFVRTKPHVNIGTIGHVDHGKVA